MMRRSCWSDGQGLPGGAALQLANDADGGANTGEAKVAYAVDNQDWWEM